MAQKEYMKNNLCSLLQCSLVALFELAFPVHSSAQNPALNGLWFYTLVNGSQLTEDCPVCDRVTVPVPMTGTFELRFLGQGPLFADYSVENVAFTAGQPGGRTYKVSGHGTYRIGGEIGVQQDLALEVTIDNGSTNTPCEFTNALPLVARHWPMFRAETDQTNGTLIQQYRLEISAAPFREIWFSTTTNFQASIWNAPTNSLSGGDLLSSVGRVVKRNRDLSARLGIQPPTPDLGLKDIDILPDGEIVFSMEQSIFSETLGPLSPQELLSDRGRIVHHANTDLIANFQPVAPLPESVGLDAIQLMDDGQVYFSVENEFGSAKLGVTVQPGDLLSDNGTIVRSGPQLLAGFNPANPTNDYGLKSVYVWPSGEVWFSTRAGFNDTNNNFFAAGDLLSDQGYLVYSNAELLSAFSPLESPANLGLDALYIITDVSPTTRVTSLGVPLWTNSPAGDVLLQRSKGQRVFQLEAASSVSGPFLPITPITTDALFVEPGVLTNQTQRFYRLHQW
jgi:hypothetical protein